MTSGIVFAFMLCSLLLECFVSEDVMYKCKRDEATSVRSGAWGFGLVWFGIGAESDPKAKRLAG